MLPSDPAQGAPLLGTESQPDYGSNQPEAINREFICNLAIAGIGIDGIQWNP